MKRKQAGFTLIEVMITVAIVAILAAIAVPSYTRYIQQGKISDGVERLSEAKVRMEQVFNSQRTYMPGGSCPSLSGGFAGASFGLDVTCNETTFKLTIKGTSSAGMSGFEYTLDQDGSKTSKTPNSGGVFVSCWLLKGEGACS